MPSRMISPRRPCPCGAGPTVARASAEKMIDFFGDDLFTYSLSDGLTTSPSAAVTISVTSVNDPPDVQDDVYRQAITAAGTGCMAAIDTERWLAERSAE